MKSLCSAVENNIKRLKYTMEPINKEDYLNAMEDTSLPIQPLGFDLEIPITSQRLPPHFPAVATPRYPDGSCLRWMPSDGGVDWGIAIGRFYAYAPHLCRWSWKYIIFLDCDSPSAAWIVADTAWEDDLEPLPPEDEQ
jgi:hypothetical protein